jgi:hypothetical protein
MSEQPIQDINDGKPWSEMDLFDLPNSQAHTRLRCIARGRRRHSPKAGGGTEAWPDALYCSR